MRRQWKLSLPFSLPHPRIPGKACSQTKCRSKNALKDTELLMGFCPRKLRKAKVLSQRIGMEESLVCYITIKLTTNRLYRSSVLKGRRARMFATACRRYRRRTRNACLAEPRAARWGMVERHRTRVASAWSLYSLI